MRIGTWNMEGRGRQAQTDFLLGQDCDVLLLTEVPDQWSLEGYYLTPGGPDMGPRKRWAAVASRSPLVPIASPHAASTAAIVERTTFVASILPWAGSGGHHPWRGVDHHSRVKDTLDALAPFIGNQTDLVWGGDWNHSLAGREKAGSQLGRLSLQSLLTDLGLGVPTSGLAHRLDGLLTIDHIAMRCGADEARRVIAEDEGKRLSDHDFYFVVT
jgi:hypothetical protein